MATPVDFIETAPVQAPVVLAPPTELDTLEVIVTIDDIERGVRKMGANCPIVLAARRQIGWPLVDHGGRMNTDGHLHLWAPQGHVYLGRYYNRDAGIWARRFDARGKRSVAPERFVFRKETG